MIAKQLTLGTVKRKLVSKDSSHLITKSHRPESFNSWQPGGHYAQRCWDHRFLLLGSKTRDTGYWWLLVEFWGIWLEWPDIKWENPAKACHFCIFFSFTGWNWWNVIPMLKWSIGTPQAWPCVTTFFLNSWTAQVLMIEVGNSSSLIILERSMWVTSTALDRHRCDDSRCQAGKNGSRVMRFIILLLDVWWRGSPVTPRRLEKFCWKMIAVVTRLTSYRAEGIVGCRRCRAWSIARGTRTSSLCLTLKHFIQRIMDHWTTWKGSRNEGILKLWWLLHETFK